MTSFSLNGVRLNGNSTTIDVLCRYDATCCTYKTIINISGSSMHYVWYNMPRRSSIKDLLIKIRKIYDLNIESIDSFEETQAIVDILSRESSESMMCIDKLTVTLNGNKNNELEYELSSIFSSDDAQILKRNIYSYLDDIYCPLQCEVKYDALVSKIYNEIPRKEELFEFICAIPQKEIVSRHLSINISLPLIQLKIDHQDGIYYFYGFKNILFLCDDTFDEYASKIINNKYSINYHDVLDLLKIDGFTLMDPKNPYLELDLYQEISANASLKTASLSLRNECKRCVICQQDNVSQSEFTRINCCEHRYHYLCLKQYIEHNARRTAPQCPLCRKPFTVIQVHNNLILQTIDVRHLEFDSDHDILSLFSDHENDELIAVSSEPLAAPPPPIGEPYFDDLDEFYRVGLSIINSNNNSAEINIDDNNDNNDDYIPSHINIDDDDDDDDDDRDDQIVSKSSTTDRIGRLSLSNLSTSATQQSNPRRPSLRYVYSPLPASPLPYSSPISQYNCHQISPTPTRSLSPAPAPVLFAADALKLHPIPSLHSMPSHLLFDAISP